MLTVEGLTFQMPHGPLCSLSGGLVPGRWSRVGRLLRRVVGDSDDIGRRGGKPQVVGPVDISVRPGELMGLVGPCAPWVVKALAGTIPGPVGGVVKLGATAYAAKDRAWNERVGCVVGGLPLWWDLDVGSFLSYLAACRGREAVFCRELLTELGMEHLLRAWVPSLTLQEASVLALCQGVVHRPEVVLVAFEGVEDGEMFGGTTVGDGQQHPTCNIMEWFREHQTTLVWAATKREGLPAGLDRVVTVGARGQSPEEPKEGGAPS